MTRNRAMLIGALAAVLVLGLQAYLKGDAVRIGHVGGWAIGGALLGLGVKWLLTRHRA